MKDFIFPVLDYGQIVCAVYKMVFDDGSYYIGSTSNLKQRMWGWKFKLNKGIDKNHKVTAAFKETTKVIFEILEVIDDPIFKKLREDGYIKLNIGKPLFLNIASNAYNNKGVKQNPNKKRNVSQFQPIAMVSEDGEILETFDCISDAEIKYNATGISNCFINNRRKSKGMIFRKLDEEGNIIPAPAPVFKERKKPNRKHGYHISEEARLRLLAKKEQKIKDGTFKYPPNTKKIIQYTVSGELVKIYESSSAAAREFNSDTRNFKRQVRKSKRNYYKGYIFKYA